MPGDFWLIDFQNFDEEAHAYLVFADEIDQAQTGSVSQCFEEKSDVVFVVCHASFDCVPAVDYYDFGPAVVPFLPEFPGNFSLEFTRNSAGILPGSCVQSRSIDRRY
jgi:hypothetical protein